MIYEHVFFDASCTGVDTRKTLVPLLTCRQFYNEALRIAFSSVTFHLNWHRIAEKYYDGAWYESENAPRVRIESRIDGIIVENRIEPPATRNPMDFNIECIAGRAGLSNVHLSSIRRIMVTSYLDLPKAGEWALWTMFHFLTGLASMKSRDFQLDMLIIRTPFESDWPSTFEFTTSSLTSQYNALLSALWRQKITKRLIVDNIATVTGIGFARGACPHWFSAQHSHRMYCTGQDFMEKYMDRIVASEVDNQEVLMDLDDVQNPAGWEFVFQKYLHWPGQIDFIDITRRKREALEQSKRRMPYIKSLENI